MSRNWINSELESRLLDEVQHRQRARRARAALVTRRMLDQAELYADAYPWMDPEVSQAMLQAGLSADDPRVQEAAALAAEDLRPEPMEDVADSWWEAAVNTIARPVKGVVRTGLTVLSAPMEELQALLSSAGMASRTSGGSWIDRFVENYTKKAAASGLRLAIGDLLAGREVDLGEGFLPGSYTEETMAQPGFTGGIYGRRERDKHRLTIDGHFVTPGRLFAREFVEPGTQAWNILSGAADFVLHVLDPTVVVGKAAKTARVAHKTFQSTGLINGLRKTVNPERAIEHFLTSKQGQLFKKWLAETDSTLEIWDVIKRADLQTAHRLARAADETQVHEILAETLGTVIRERPTAGFVSRQMGRLAGDYGKLFGGGAVVRKALNERNFRIIHDMPGTKLHLGNLDQAADDLEKWMRNAKLDQDFIAKTIERMAAEVPEGGATAMYAIVRDVMTHTEGVLVKEWGVSPSRARRVTKLWEDMVQRNRSFQADDIGGEVDALAPLRVFVDGKQIDASPHAAIIADLISSGIPLPDPREIRRLTPMVKRMQKLYDSGLWKGPIDFLDFAMSSIWKPLQLLRFAYTFRVIGEEQIRMGAAGLDSLASHPVRAIAAMLGWEPSSPLAKRIANAATDIGDLLGRGAARARKALGKTDDVMTGTGKYATDVHGVEFTEEMAEFAMAMSRGSAGWRGLPGQLLTGKWVRVSREETEVFYQGWAERLVHLYHDPVMKRFARGLSKSDLKTMPAGFTPSGNNFDDVAEWFLRGGGRKYREELATAIGGDLGKVLLHNDEAARNYLRQNFFDQLQRLTGGDSNLMNFVATGQLDGVSVRKLGSERKLARLLEDKYDYAAPAFVPMEDRVALRHRGARFLQRLAEVTEYLFGALMSKPTNYLSRSPAFRQFYWRRVDELIGFADEATQKAMIRAAKEAGVSKKLLDSMVKKAARGGPGNRITSLDDVDLLAKGFALEETKNLLYDLGKRSQLFDQLRLVFPFGEAWKEILTSWTRILYQNPHVLRRTQQIIHGARGGDQDPSTGIFHIDPQTGEEVFTYPDFGLLTKLVDVEGTGRVRPVGRVAGLNLVAASVLPGFGPVVQIPVQNLIPHKPEFEVIHELVSPFGEAEGERLSHQIIDAFTPAWLKKLQTGLDSPESNRLFANTVMDVMRALHRDGRRIDTPDDIDALYREAVTKSRLLYFIRGAAQMTLPTGPMYAWETADVEGNLVPVKLLADELRRMTDEEYGGDRNAAFIEWTKRFGVDNVLAIIPKSQEIVERPVTKQGDEWLRANPDLETRYPTVVGYFAPEPAVGEFDYDAYLRAFETGARQPFTPREFVALANDFLGRVEYEQAKRVAALRPGPQTSLWLAEVRKDIARRRPGFDSWLADRVREQRPAVDQMIEEVKNAVTDPRIARTDAGQGAIKYLQAMQKAQQMVQGLGGNVKRYQTAKAALPIRMFLRDAAAEIIAEHPSFARLWVEVFERELADDDELILGGG